MSGREFSWETTGWPAALIMLACGLVAFVPWFLGVITLVDAALELVGR